MRHPNGSAVEGARHSPFLLRVAIPAGLAAVLLLVGSVAVAQPSGDRPAKIAPALAEILLQLEGASLSRESLTPRGPEQLSTALVRVDRRARLHVYIHIDRLDDLTVAELEAAGLMVEQTAPKYGLVQGWIPFERMRDLAALANVRRIRPPDYAVSRGGARQPPPSPDAAGSRP